MDPLDILLSAFEREEDLRTPSPPPPSSPAAAPPSLSSSSSSSAAPQSTSSSSDTPPPIPTSSSSFSPAPPSVPSPSPHSTPPTSFSLPSPAASPHLLFTLDNSLNSDFEPLLASPGLTPFTTSTPPPATPSLPQDLLTGDILLLYSQFSQGKYFQVSSLSVVVYLSLPCLYSLVDPQVPPMAPYTVFNSL